MALGTAMMTTADAQTLRHALTLFARGAYFDCHEALEPLWLAAPAESKGFYQGLIQLAAALVHWRRGYRPAILPLLDAAHAKLARVAPDTAGLDLPALVASLTAARAYFRQPEATVAGFDAGRLLRIERRPVTVGDLP